MFVARAQCVPLGSGLGPVVYFKFHGLGKVGGATRLIRVS